VQIGWDGDQQAHRCSDYGDFVILPAVFLLWLGQAAVTQPRGPEAMDKFEEERVWCGFCISTTLGQASIQDLLLLFAFTCAHPTLKYDKQTIWLDVGKLMLPPFLQMCGSWLDSWAYHLSQQKATELPLLMSKGSRVGRALGPVNRMIMLHRLRKEKVVRRRVSLSHEGLVPLAGVWSRYESCLDVARLLIIHHRFPFAGPIKLWWEKHQCFSLLVKPPEQRWVLFEPTSCKGDASRC